MWKRWMDFKAAHWQLSTRGFGKKWHAVATSPCVWTHKVYCPWPVLQSSPSFSVRIGIYLRGEQVSGDVIKPVLCVHNGGTKAFAFFHAPDSACSIKSEFWAAGYYSCTDRGKYPSSWPAGEPHPSPPGAQTDALAALKRYRCNTCTLHAHVSKTGRTFNVFAPVDK